MAISIQRLAAELDATSSEIRSCAWDLRRHGSSFRPKFVTEEFAAAIRVHLPIYRQKIERRRQSVRDRQNRPLTAKDLAAELGLAPTTIRQWKARGYLEPVGKSGRELLYRFGDVANAADLVGRRTKAVPQVGWHVDQLLEKHADRGLTTNEAARLIGVSPSTLRMWVKRGHLKPVGRHGRQLLFVVRDVAAAADRHT